MIHPGQMTVRDLLDGGDGDAYAPADVVQDQRAVSLPASA